MFYTDPDARTADRLMHVQMDIRSRRMVEIVEVSDDNSRVRGLEIIIDGKVHFIGDQDRWPGIRIGKFPSPRWQDEPWKRETVYGGNNLPIDANALIIIVASELYEECLELPEPPNKWVLSNPVALMMWLEDYTQSAIAICKIISRVKGDEEE